MIGPATSEPGRPRLSPYACRCGADIDASEYVCVPCDVRAAETVLRLTFMLRRTRPDLADFLLRIVDGRSVVGSTARGEAYRGQ